jgi:hypothetical protein
VSLQINMVKYDTDQEITNIYENLQIVRTHFFTDMLLFVNIWSTSNIYWFISIRICCQWIQTNNYSFTFDYSVRYSMSNTEGILNYSHLPKCYKQKSFILLNTYTGKWQKKLRSLSGACTIKLFYHSYS